MDFYEVNIHLGYTKSRSTTLPAFQKLLQIPFLIITSHSPRETTAWLFILVFYSWVANGSNFIGISTNLWSHSLWVRSVGIVSWILCLESHQTVIKVLVMTVISSGAQDPFSCGHGTKVTVFQLLAGGNSHLLQSFLGLLCHDHLHSSENGPLLLCGQQEDFSTFKLTVRAQNLFERAHLIRSSSPSIIFLLTN